MVPVPVAVGGCDRADASAVTATQAPKEPTSAEATRGDRPEYALAIHGGAGVITRENLSSEMEAAYREKLEEALRAGESVLRDGGSSLDAVVAVLQVLEASELFNAGVGAVFTHEGRNELDASIMDGATLDAGAVAGVSTIKSPIAAARAVMERSPHVMLAGSGAEAFAASVGLEIVEPGYFKTDRRWEQLQKAKSAGDHASLVHSDWKFGTVGAVALDRAGNLAAGTSTGGMTNKRWGRIGDSPIIGAGTYAANESCAVSATGHGEFFIRRTVARDVCARVEFAGASLDEAAREVIHEQLGAMGGTGGIIAVDASGAIVLEFNSPGMYRGSVTAGGPISVEIF
jgi:beta-aspartyl-peptidase (threonine type)